MIQDSENLSSKKLHKSENKLSWVGDCIVVLMKHLDINQSKLADLLGISNSYLTEIKYGRLKKGGDKFWDAIKSIFPDWEPYFRHRVKSPPESSKSGPGSTNGTKGISRPYEQIPEHMGVPKSHLAPDSDRGSYGVPDLDGYTAKEIFIPEDIDPFAAAVSGLREIFESRDPIIVSAIQANVRAFQLSVRRERKIGQQSKEIDILKEKCEEFEEKLAAIERKLEEYPRPGLKEESINKKAI